MSGVWSNGHELSQRDGLSIIVVRREISLKTKKQQFFSNWDDEKAGNDKFPQW